MIIPGPLYDALEAHARQHGLSLDDTIIRLLRYALAGIEARAKGGKTRAARMSPEARSASAKHAVTVREQRKVAKITQ